MSPKVLIVEDQLPLAKAMAGLLARHGIIAEISGDGIDALKKYATDPYDLLIMDLQLPKLSGVEVIRKIRSTHSGKTIPIIVCTGVYKGEEYRQKAREVFGVKHYLEKPFPQEAFLTAVKESLGIVKEPPPKARIEELPADRPQPVRPAVPAPPPSGVTERKPAAPPPSRPLGPAQLGEIKPQTAMLGNLKTHPMDQLLIESRRKRVTGVLFIKKDDEERTVLFLNGLPVSLRTNRPDSSFGNFLFCQGKISLMEYQVYQGQLTTGPDPEEVLIKMGCLLPGEFYAEWRRFREESLIQMFGWAEGEFTLQLWPSLPEFSPTPPVNFGHIMHQGYKRHYNGPRLEALRKRSQGNYPVLARPYYDYQMHLAIESAEALFLDRIDGKTRFEDLLPAEEEEKEKLIRAFAAYLALGMAELRDRPTAEEIEAPFPIREREAERPRTAVVEEEEEEEETPAAETGAAAEEGEGFDDLVGDLENTLDDVVVKITKQEEPPPPAPVADAEADEQKQREEALAAFMKESAKKNYYEILGMKTPQQFEFAKMKKEYFRLTKLFSPEKFIMSSGEMLGMSEEALSVLATAYNTLSNVVSKEKYDDMLSSRRGAVGVPGAKNQDKMQAEVAFQSGLAFLQMDDWDGAEKSFSEAMSLAPNQPDIMANYAYALYNKNRKSKTIQKRVNDLLTQALKLKPKCASALAYRGVLLLDDDKVSLAEGDFKKALSINPRYKFALKGMRAVEQRKQGDKKGLLGRFMK